MAIDQPFDAGDQRQVETRAAKAKRLTKRANEDFLWLMGDARGRRFVWGLLEAGHVFQSSFIPGALDQTAFREGERNMALLLLARVMALCPDKYAVMAAEQAKDFEHG